MVTSWKRILQRILIVMVTCMLAYFIPNFRKVVSFNILLECYDEGSTLLKNT